MKHFISLLISLAVLSCITTTLIVFFFVVTSCNQIPLPVIVPQPDSEFCAAAESNLKKLSCEEGQPLEDGTSFTKFCEDTQKNGFFLNPKCLAKIRDCSSIDACSARSR